MNLNELDLHDMVPGSNDIMVRSVHWLYCRSPLLIKSIRLRVQETTQTTVGHVQGGAQLSSCMQHVGMRKRSRSTIFAVAIIPLFAVSLRKERQQTRKKTYSKYVKAHE